QHRNVRAGDAREREREVLVVPERDRPPQRAHATRDLRPRLLDAVRIHAPAGGYGVRHPDQSEGAREQLRELPGRDVAAAANALPISREDVLPAVRETRPMHTVTEL